jgi:hypothetical protein
LRALGRAQPILPRRSRRLLNWPSNVTSTTETFVFDFLLNETLPAP